jgi:hypothetical protein
MNRGFETNLSAKFTAHARAIKKAYDQSTSKNVRNKYTWLAAYHNEIAARFIPSSACLCNLS